MQVLYELQKIIQLIPHTERVLAKRWITRLLQPALFPREQKINDKYIKILEMQMLRLQQKVQLKLEYPLNLMPLDTILSDIPEFIMKKFRGQAATALQKVELQKQIGQIEEENPATKIVKQHATIRQHLSDTSFKQVDDELNELLDSCKLRSYRSDAADVSDLQISVAKEVTIPQVPPAAKSQPYLSSSIRNITQDQIKLVRSKYADISTSSPQMVTEIAESLKNEKERIQESIQQIQQVLSNHENTQLELSNDNERQSTIVHLNVKALLASDEIAKQSLQPVDSNDIAALKSKYFSQIDNSFVVDYEQTPYNRNSLLSAVESSGRNQYIKQNSSYGSQQNSAARKESLNSQSIKDEEEKIKIQKRREVYHKLTEKQESNKALFTQVQNEVKQAQVQYLIDRVNLLEVNINDQEQLITQFFELLE